MTDALQIAPQHKYLTKRFYDVVNPTGAPPADGKQIAIDVIKKAGLRAKK